MLFTSPLDNSLLLAMFAFAFLGLDAYRIDLEGWTKCAFSAIVSGVILCVRIMNHQTQINTYLAPDEVTTTLPEILPPASSSLQPHQTSPPSITLTAHASSSTVHKSHPISDRGPSILSPKPRPWIELPRTLEGYSPPQLPPSPTKKAFQTSTTEKNTPVSNLRKEIGALVSRAATLDDKVFDSAQPDNRISSAPPSGPDRTQPTTPLSQSTTTHARSIAAPLYDDFTVLCQKLCKHKTDTFHLSHSIAQINLQNLESGLHYLVAFREIIDAMWGQLKEVRPNGLTYHEAQELNFIVDTIIHLYQLLQPWGFAFCSSAETRAFIVSFLDFGKYLGIEYNPPHMQWRKDFCKTYPPLPLPRAQRSYLRPPPKRLGRPTTLVVNVPRIDGAGSENPRPPPKRLGKPVTLVVNVPRIDGAGSENPRPPPNRLGKPVTLVVNVPRIDGAGSENPRPPPNRLGKPVTLVVKVPKIYGDESVAESKPALQRPIDAPESTAPLNPMSSTVHHSRTNDKPSVTAHSLVEPVQPRIENPATTAQPSTSPPRTGSSIVQCSPALATNARTLTSSTPARLVSTSVASTRLSATPSQFFSARE
ncbi:hypothetical protein BDV96DRAFT_646416 [Lophiotrema nucula]|uniref:Uncharacterized protein n=1 Tax=Lophiotrema nucula TaxID=690887 RepID=A0A6A5Z9J0_9PLEO|nr:hypothetical protein BDV96DRAFT_646416 [Lophiotrema nucula]